MTPQRWSRIRELFGTALETPESERRRFLEAAWVAISSCGSNDQLFADQEMEVRWQRASMRILATY